jgi:hypothetical protein
VPPASGAPAASNPGASPSVATSSPVASVAAPDGNVAASPTAPPQASAPPPVASAPPPAATASAAASVAGVAPKKVEFPEEPRCYGGPCAERVRCVPGAATPLPDGLPAPFRGCTTYGEQGTFSKKRSQEQRQKEPGACCYVQLQRPPLGRPLEVASQPRIAALVGPAGWA